ncbi:MAG: patatin-like phospholipase family protein [Pseudomonadota bacterium]|nr:patatin-like phospholipase family protein [Pseudomonadota bacterium]
MKPAVARPQPRTVSSRKPIGLALQGGGSWGAYTWGVLDSLLASRSVTIAQLSGTSAGAINAAIVASALAKGAPAQAREALRAFWMQIAHPASHDIGRAVWGPVERTWRESMGAWLMSTGALSPYNTNPLGVNPLRDAITAHVDIEAIRSKSAPALFVTVTNVKTGLPRVISNDAMTIDAVLASACLPQLFQAVEIDGEAYWDGGYAGNPTLWPMIHSGVVHDLIVVQLVPDTTDDVPTHAPAIRQRVGEIQFNSSLVAEMQAIAAMRSVAARGDSASSVLDLRLHRIGPPPRELLEQESSMERSRVWLQRLHREGRSAAKRFNVRHGADLGVRETLDIARVFADEHKPKMRAPANEAVYDNA